MIELVPSRIISIPTRRQTKLQFKSLRRWALVGIAAWTFAQRQLGRWVDVKIIEHQIPIILKFRRGGKTAVITVKIPQSLG